MLALLTSAAGARAQDLRQVTSPDGRVQFRIFLAQPQPAALFRLAYQVLYDGKPVLDTSFLGLEILNQPILGENVGLTSSKTTKGDAYNGLLAQYMQNGSLGRRINLEVRVYDQGIAFRYVVPESGPLRPMLIVDESTEFHLGGDARLFENRKAVPLSQVDSEALLPLPVTAELPGVAWVRIAE
ncbi:MAG TPA: glycoside hydrolase family 97 N-terminal domain-containing protein, partial [Bryobacteraceae bacterium]|nr:glycoside hydrolase family 97 N-terminal domain-containing protein [Bryobacteraceae bacterium]